MIQEQTFRLIILRDIAVHLDGGTLQDILRHLSEQLTRWLTERATSSRENARICETEQYSSFGRQIIARPDTEDEIQR